MNWLGNDLSFGLGPAIGTFELVSWYFVLAVEKIFAFLLGGEPRGVQGRPVGCVRALGRRSCR